MLHLCLPFGRFFFAKGEFAINRSSWGDKFGLSIPQRIHGTEGIFTYMEWLIIMVNVGKYTVHGWYKYGILLQHQKTRISVAQNLNNNALGHRSSAEMI